MQIKRRGQCNLGVSFGGICSYQTNEEKNPLRDIVTTAAWTPGSRPKLGLTGGKCRCSQRGYKRG